MASNSYELSKICWIKDLTASWNDCYLLNISKFFSKYHYHSPPCPSSINAKQSFFRLKFFRVCLWQNQTTTEKRKKEMVQIKKKKKPIFTEKHCERFTRSFCKKFMTLFFGSIGQYWSSNLKVRILNRRISQ